MEFNGFMGKIMDLMGFTWIYWDIYDDIPSGILTVSGKPCSIELERMLANRSQIIFHM
jgi:hypothetical protein